LKGGFFMEKKRTRIKIYDLPKDMKITKDELKRIKGGVLTDLVKVEGRPTSFARICYPPTFVGLKV
jgi:hypothetical protein